MKALIFVFTFLLIQACSHHGTYVQVQPSPGEKRLDHEATGTKYMISTQGHFSTKAAKEMFDQGGNAADAAVAISFVIGVERPQSTGIGGGGFLLFHKPGLNKPISYDFREKAPFKSHSKIFLDRKGKEVPRKSLDGIFAAGTPGLVAGVLKFHKEHGKLPLNKVLAPAIKLARKGFPIYRQLAKALKYRRKVLENFPGSKKIFFNKDGSYKKEGDTLIQEDLAKTMEAIAEHGAKGFYKGWVAKAIIKETKRLGGLISQRDLNKYNVKMRSPVSTTYKGHDIYSMAPPSSGGIHVIQILNTVEHDNLKKLGPHHPKSIHLTASAMQQAFADRARYLGDADFVKVPIKELTSKSYAQKIRARIQDEKARPQKSVHAGKFKGFTDHDETTHFSVMDSEGFVVSSTQTINGWFGSGVIVPGTGILLNNEMDDFATKVGASNLFGAVGGRNNLVAPGKRPLSSMSPTIVLKDNKPVLAVGTPSGTRILTCVALTLLNVLEHEMPLYDAVATTRYHQQWSPDEIRVGEFGFPKYVEPILKIYGHKVRYKNLGCKIQAIQKVGDELIGVSDPRGQGMSVGE